LGKGFKGEKVQGSRFKGGKEDEGLRNWAWIQPRRSVLSVAEKERTPFLINRALEGRLVCLMRHIGKSQIWHRLPLRLLPFERTLGISQIPGGS
jgi:hypothetical protein